MAKKDASASMVGWSDAPEALVLRRRQAEMRQQLHRVEEAIHPLRRRLDEYPQVRQHLLVERFRERATDADVASLEARNLEMQAQVEALEIELLILQQDLSAMPDAIREVEEVAQAVLADQLQADDLADDQLLFDAYMKVIEVSERKAKRLAFAEKQFPQPVYGTVKPYAKGIQSRAGLMHKCDASGLQPSFDPDFVRSQRGHALWSPLVLGGHVKEMVDALRRVLRMPEDKGEIPPAGQIALAEHRRAAAEDRLRPERVAHERAAAAYNAERQRERDREAVAHRQATQQALTDALRK